MSLSYASRLTQGVDYGECGSAEYQDTARVRTREMEKLVKLIRAARYLVVHTGAGISTSCGIRDFRGPNGVWTREKRGLGFDLLPGDVPFEEASPSLTHMAILALVEAGKCQYVVSQNVDGLHLRSGFPVDKLSELHGNIFQEKCVACGKVFFRNFDCGGVGFRVTPRKCDDCENEPLYDMVLDWDDALPERDYRLARQHSLLADVALALGMSMRVHPAATIPLITVDKTQRKHSALSGVEEEIISWSAADKAAIPVAGTKEGKKLLCKNGALAIINLQPTPHDSDASVRLHAKCDDIMLEVMQRLDIPIPDYVRVELYSICQTADGKISIVTDLFVRNALFVSSIIILYKDSDAEKLNKVLLSSKPWEWDATEAGLTTETCLDVTIMLNQNATVASVEMQHIFIPGKELITQQPFEVVRKQYWVASAVTPNEEDDEEADDDVVVGFVGSGGESDSKKIKLE